MYDPDELAEARNIAATRRAERLQGIKDRRPTRTPEQARADFRAGFRGFHAVESAERLPYLRAKAPASRVRRKPKGRSRKIRTDAGAFVVWKGRRLPVVGTVGPDGSVTWSDPNA